MYCLLFNPIEAHGAQQHRRAQAEHLPTDDVCIGEVKQKPKKQKKNRKRHRVWTRQSKKE